MQNATAIIDGTGQRSVHFKKPPDVGGYLKENNKIDKERTDATDDQLLMLWYQDAFDTHPQKVIFLLIWNLSAKIRQSNHNHWIVKGKMVSR